MRSSENRNCVSSISRLMDLNLRIHQVNKTFESKYGLSVVQWSLLKTLLNMPAVSPHLLAKALGVTPGTLSQALSRLNRKSYLFMCDDPCDARKKMISITRLGKEAMEAGEKEFERVFSGVETIDGEITRINEYLRDQVKFRLGDLTGN